MCTLCEHGLNGPADMCLETGTVQVATGAEGAAASGKPTFNWDQAGGHIAEYGWWHAGSSPVTYAFRSVNSSDPGFKRFDANLIAQTEKAFQLWSDVANIDFQRVGSGTIGEAAYSNDATILLQGDTDSGGYGWAYFPGSTASPSLAGDVFLNTSGNNFNDVSEGSYEYLALLHEIGHAIGLNHPGSYNGGSPTYAANAEYFEDSRQYTLMSYFAAENTGASHGWNFASTPLLHDIAAAQNLYGINWSTRADDSVYGFNSNAGDSYIITSSSDSVVFAIWDGGGNDTLDVSGYRDNQIIDLNEEAFSDVGGLTANIAIARGAVIENASTGAGADTLTGNAADNILSGNANKDDLFGEGGNDTLNGGSSNDRLYGGEGSDTLNGGAHKDHLWGGNGDDTLNGGSGDDYMYGEAGNDTMTGGTGNDRLFGGEGNDTIDGGSGNDFVFAGAGDDDITGGSGFDTIDFSAFSDGATIDLNGHTASSTSIGNDTIWGVENVKATSGDDTITGDKRDNAIWGLDGDDWFRGMGGADTFKGGAGTDTYYWALNDIIKNGEHLGVDTIRDFSVNQDVLDVSRLIADGVDGITLSQTEGGTLVQAQVAGTGLVNVALLEDRYGLDAAALFGDDALIV